MKVWLPTPATGTGSEVFTRQLADALSRRNIEAIVSYYPKQIEAMPKLIASLNIRPPSNTDIIHLGAGSATSFFRFGIPSVITGHGAFERSDYDTHKSILQRLYHSILVRPSIKEAANKANTVTAVSQWVANIYRQDYAAQKVEVINNWVDPDIFSPIKKTPNRKLLFVGRAAWQKGSHLLPELCKLLGSDFELTCTIRANEWAGKIPGNVHLVGPVAQDKMPALYRAHDALIVPSIAEGFCLAAAEAMACGLPVFGFRGHGLDDILGPMINSCSAKLLDLDSLTNSIKEVFGKPQTYRDISEQCHQHVMSRFTEEIALAKYISLYQKIMS